MNQQSNVVSGVSGMPGMPGASAGPAKVRLPAPVILARLKAERTEQPLSAAKALEAMAGLPGWGLSPKAINLSRVFYFPSAEEAQAYSDFLHHMGRGLKVQMRVAVEKDRVYLALRGSKRGIPPYLLDFAALLSQ
jgi:hypothetical protein